MTSLASAIEQAAEAIVITDPRGSVQFVNPAFTRMTGYSAEEAIGQSPRMLKSGMQSPGYYEDLWRTICGGRPWHGELVNRRKDGTLYTEEMTITPVRDASGVTTSFIAIKQDVTERRALEEAHRFLASIVESAEEAVVSHKPDGTIMTWNRAAAELHGYTAEEAVGQSLQMLIAPESLAKVRAWTEGLQRGESFRQVESVVLRKSGERVHVQVSLCPIRNAAGEVTAFAAIVRDITERKRAEQALRDSEERFRTAFEHAPFGICLSSSDGRLVRTNATFCQMLGYSEEELIELGWVAITHPEDRVFAQEECRRILRDKPSGVDFEKRYIRKDGAVFWARIRISVPNAAADQTWDFVTHVEDITEQKGARESLRRSEEKYRRLIANLPDVTWSSNLHGETAYISPNVQDVFGFSPAEICAGGTELRFGRIHPQDQARVRESYRALFAGQRAFDEQYRFQRRDGEWIWLHDRAMRTYEADGAWFADGVLSDITKRRHTEEALAESERRYRLLFERNLAGVFRALPDERLVDCNDALLRILGYGSAAEFLGHRASEIFYDPVDQRATFERLYRERSLTNHDVRLKRKDGTPVWVLENVSLVDYEDGRPAFIEGTLFDISARQQAEQALRESEEKYRTLVTNLPDVIWTADADGRLVFVSPNSAQIYGWTPEELRETAALREQVHPEDRERAREAYAAFMSRGQPYSVEYRVKRKDGLFVWVHDRAFQSYEKNGRRYADGCASDVNEQRLYADLAQRLQRRTELILNSAGEGIVGLNPDGRLTFVNPAAARMLESTPAGLIGEKLHRISPRNRTGGAERADGACGILSCLLDGNEHRGEDELPRSVAGGGFPVEYTSTPKFESGRLVGAVVVFRDITEARRAREHVEASLKEKEALLREIHHRVKNNLQIVCSLLKLNSRGLRDPEALHVFEDTRHRVKAMALVHETLYRSGDLAGIDFSEYIPRLAEQLLHAYGLTRRQVAVSLAVEPLVLPIDTAIPCALMLTELISNSAKHAFVAAGGGELRIAFRRVQEPNWLLQVEDSGGGGASPAPSGAASGSGSSFGLELVSLLTDQLSGTVSIERKPGFCVSVNFPVSGSPEAEINRGSIG